MNYKAIKIDMDYCADPIWVSEDGVRFPNGCISEFEGILSKALLHSLEVYRCLWEKAHWTEHLSPTDMELWPGSGLIFDCLGELQLELAAKLKEELPDVRVYIGVYSENSDPRWQLLEIGGEQPKGFYSTMVG